jgi:hypothetical protein
MDGNIPGVPSQLPIGNANFLFFRKEDFAETAERTDI